jgi:FkbM family methyltransferase
MLAALKGVLRRRGVIDRSPMKGFLRHAVGVIHVGAHTGQERVRYAQYRLNVLWIEPIPEIFAALRENLAGFAAQRAVECLVTDKDGAEYEFHVTSNRGGSSSIFPLGRHKDIWPEVRETATLTLRSKTLPTLLADERIDARQYDALVMDTQGSELLVLEGAAPLLDRFKFVKTEVADFPAYEGGCQLKDIESLMQRFGFRELARNTIARHPQGGAYYDIVYGRPRAG